MQVLEHYFGGQEWLAQTKDGLELYLDRCIGQFAGVPAPINNAPISDGSDYREYARTAEEIKRTMAAEEAAVSAAKVVPRYRQRPDEVEIPESELADPMRNRIVPASEPKQPNGWAL